MSTAATVANNDRMVKAITAALRRAGEYPVRVDIDSVTRINRSDPARYEAWTLTATREGVASRTFHLTVAAHAAGGFRVVEV